jgi:hypothetical protein
MTKKWIAINLMLLLAAGLLAWRLNVAVKAFNEENSLDALARNQAKKKGAAEAGLPALQPVRKVAEADFVAIADQDLFAEARHRPEEPVAPPPLENRALDIKPILVGVLISGSQRLAYINDPAGAAAQGSRKSQTLRLGDNYRGFVVTDITESNMVLEYGASREVIPLYDTAKPPQSGKTPILTTRVVNFGAGSSGGSPVVAATPVSSAAAATGRLGAASPPAAGNAQRVVAPAVNANQIRGFTGTGPQGQPTGGQAAGATPQGANWNQGVNPQGQTVINSPFGQFTVPAPAAPVKK